MDEVVLHFPKHKFFIGNVCIRLIQTQLARSVEYTNCISAVGYDFPNESADMTVKKTEWGSSNAGHFGNAEHPLIAILPRSNLDRIWSTW